MKGLDTNLLLRLFVGDDPGQLRAATRYIERIASAGLTGFVNRVVLCELIWTLRRMYHLDRDDIGRVLDTLFNMRELEIDARDLALDALRQFHDGHDFADALIGLTNRMHGCSVTGTFDQDATRIDGFEMVTA